MYIASISTTHYSSITSLVLVLWEDALLEGLGRVPDPCNAAAHSWQLQNWPFPWPDVSTNSQYMCVYVCIQDTNHTFNYSTPIYV